MMLLQLFVLLIITIMLYSFILIGSGGIMEPKPLLLTHCPDQQDILRAIRRGASPLWLADPLLHTKQLAILRRRYPWIFTYGEKPPPHQR